jgi:hypothetical protein
MFYLQSALAAFDFLEVYIDHILVLLVCPGSCTSP